MPKSIMCSNSNLEIGSSAATIPQYKYCILHHNILQYIGLLLFLFNMGKGGGEKEGGKRRDRRK